MGEDIVLLNLEGVSDFTDYFVLSSGSSERMLNSLADAVDKEIKEITGLDPVKEGLPGSGWVVLDYGSVVVHLLSPELREYYDLEDLWKKGKLLLRLQ